MKYYKFRFTNLILGLLWAALALCAAGFIWNIIRFLQTGADGVYQWLQYGILFFTTVFFAALIISMFICSRYTITDKQLITQFGFIRSKYDIANITSIHLFRGAGKLAVYFNDNKYMVIVVKSEWYDDFIKELLQRNDKIGFSFSTAEEEEEIKKNKKK